MRLSYQSQIVPAAVQRVRKKVHGLAIRQEHIFEYPVGGIQSI